MKLRRAVDGPVSHLIAAGAKLRPQFFPLPGPLVFLATELLLFRKPSVEVTWHRAPVCWLAALTRLRDHRSRFRCGVLELWSQAVIGRILSLLVL